MKIMANIEVDQIIETFVSAIPAVLNTLQLVLQKGEEDDLISLLEDLDTCMEQEYDWNLMCRCCCSYMRDHIRTIIELSLAIAQTQNFSPSVRQLAAHIVATIAYENGGMVL